MIDESVLRELVEWHGEYKPEWDGTPEAYSEAGVVGWGKSRRLGLFKLGRYKAYLGVQHVDPSKPGWGFIEEPQTRFFLSFFVEGRCVTLRTFGSMGEALGALYSLLA